MMFVERVKDTRLRRNPYRVEMWVSVPKKVPRKITILLTLTMSRKEIEENENRKRAKDVGKTEKEEEKRETYSLFK